MKHIVNGEPRILESLTATRIEVDGDRLVVNGSSGTRTALVKRAGGKTHVSYLGRTYVVEQMSRSKVRHESAVGELTAPMPGQIVEVFCDSGDQVEAGARLLVLEAMKMQQPVTAPFAGLVQTLHVAAGDQVVEGQILVTMGAANE